MQLLNPEWLILLPVMGLMGWFWRQFSLQKPLRIFCLVLLVFILCQPRIRYSSDGLDLWILADRSASALDQLTPALPEWETLLEKSKSSKDRIFYVDYADEVILREKSDVPFPGSQQFTRLATALHYALAQMKSDRSSRILVLTDGFSTEPLTGISERLIRQNVPLDYRLTTDVISDDYRIESLHLPQQVQFNEPFLIELRAVGPARTGSIPVEFRRNDQPIGRLEMPFQDGRGLLRLTDRINQPGAFRYSARILPSTDSQSGNNEAQTWIEVMGGPRVILISPYPDDPIATVLQKQGFQVEPVLQPSKLNLGILSGAKCVVLNNIPASQISSDFMNALDFYVREQGGGLLMLGGKNSFGSGGYFQSPVADLLPVSLELRQEHRKLTVAMAIVLDRSGSMSAGVSGGGLTKMDLANSGAARAIELLGVNDAITVFAVDSEAQQIIPLTSVGDHQRSLIETVSRISSGGGGIYVYQGLKAAWSELQKRKAGQRHIILFADAADAEEPGDYKNLISTMTREGVTLSVIGLGRETDTDASFLRDVAERGHGRIFFNENPNDLPAVFAQETVAVARSAFIEEPVEVISGLGWMELAAKPLQWIKTVEGYNLSYLKPEANGSLFTGDEYSAPLLASWQCGIGRAVAVTFPVAGAFSQKVREWPQYGNLLQTLTRWLIGEQLPPGIGLTTQQQGSQLQLNLFFNSSWNQTMAQTPPKIRVVQRNKPQVESIVWQRLRPGHYQAVTELKGHEPVRGVVQIGERTLPFGPLLSSINPEFEYHRERMVELQNVSHLSGGEERIQLSKIWQAPRRSNLQDPTLFLLDMLLIGLLLEAAQTRLGFSVNPLKILVRKGEIRN